MQRPRAFRRAVHRVDQTPHRRGMARFGRLILTAGARPPLMKQRLEPRICRAAGGEIFGTQRFEHRAALLRFPLQQRCLDHREQWQPHRLGRPKLEPPEIPGFSQSSVALQQAEIEQHQRARSDLQQATGEFQLSPPRDRSQGNAVLPAFGDPDMRVVPRPLASHPITRQCLHFPKRQKLDSCTANGNAGK